MPELAERTSHYPATPLKYASTGVFVMSIKQGGRLYGSLLNLRAALLETLAAKGAGEPFAPQTFSYRGSKTLKKSRSALNHRASWLAAKSLNLIERKSKVETPNWELITSAVPELPKLELPDVFFKVSTVTGTYTVQRQESFAVVELGGSQFKVTSDDVIYVNFLRGAEVNDIISLNRVLLLGSRYQTIVGRPYIPGAAVLAAVEEHMKDAKIHVYKYRKGKTIMQNRGHRQQLTGLRILEVKGIRQDPGPAEPASVQLPAEFLQRQKLQHL